MGIEQKQLNGNESRRSALDTLSREFGASLQRFFSKSPTIKPKSSKLLNQDTRFAAMMSSDPARINAADACGIAVQ